MSGTAGRSANPLRLAETSQHREHLEETQAYGDERLDETVDYDSTGAGRSSSRVVSEEIPSRIAGYRLIRVLGSGGMGTVFEADDEQQGQRVAIKLIAHDFASSKEAVERFRREGRLASAVTHPRCVFVLAVDEHEGRPYIVMELMPGSTLQTHVENVGALDPPEAILKIFDVMEGLKEFHKRGLIHRDVKPSNCFLEEEGRVKIGDFGLSKALDSDAGLTRTGTFVGTPLYASPEQIKRDEMDERTDVYSVAATLYFLLTGRPPVQATDAAEALARIVSEPAPSLRLIRPEIPRALENVIQKGLERDPSRRWRNLSEFHDALLPFVPSRLSMASLWLRVGAYLVDVGFAYLVSWAIFGIILASHQWKFMETIGFYQRQSHVLGWSERGLWLVYFTLLEGFFGATLGKWLVGLRVHRTDRGGPAGLGHGFLRAAIFYMITELPADLAAIYMPPASDAATQFKLLVSMALIRAAGFLSLTLTMRHRSGFRGPHEWLSQTWVALATGRSRVRLIRRLSPTGDSRLISSVIAPPPERLERVGPYRILGTVRWEPGRKVLLGQDSTLERPVWIVLNEPGRQAIPAVRRLLNRRCRPRWIGGGDDSQVHWNAFTVPSGTPLVEFVKTERLTWRDTLALLEDLTEELEQAMTEGTLPAELHAEQVWIEDDGSVQLNDILGRDREANVDPVSPGSNTTPVVASPPGLGSGESQRLGPELLMVMRFLGEVSRLALEGSREGRPRGMSPAEGWGRRDDLEHEPAALLTRGTLARLVRIKAAVPERSRVLLDRLTGVRAPFSSLTNLRRELALAASRPTELAMGRRVLHLLIQGFFLLPGLFLIFYLAGDFAQPIDFPWKLEAILGVSAAWVIWAAAAQGGISYALARISIVKPTGLPAGRLSCGLRSLIVWTPPTLLLFASRYLLESVPGSQERAFLLWLAAVILVFLIDVVLALLFPGKGIHDRLARTVLVPY